MKSMTSVLCLSFFLLQIEPAPLFGVLLFFAGLLSFTLPFFPLHLQCLL